ncbi:MAG: hypothetical protein ACOYNL_09205 [Rickettsiales bacterium]
MYILTKLFGIWAVGKTVSSTTPLFMRLILGMAAVTLFAVFAAVVSAMLVGILTWFSFYQLTAHGLSDGLAIAVIALVMLSIVLTIVMAMQHYWRKACSLAKTIMYVQSPISGRLNTLTEAFIGGFNTKV